MVEGCWSSLGMFFSLSFFVRSAFRGRRWRVALVLSLSLCVGGNGGRGWVGIWSKRIGFGWEVEKWVWKAFFANKLDG